MTDAKFASLGAFLAAVLRDMHGEQQNGDKHQRVEGLVYSAVALGNSEGGGTVGGYLVPAQFAAQLWTRVNGVGKILSRCTRQAISKGDVLIVPAVAENGNDPSTRFGGARVVWTGEADADTSSEINIERIELELKKLLGLVYASDELLEDAPALADAIDRMFGLEASFAIEDAIINGNGTTQPLGVLKSGALIIVGADNGQAAKSVSASNLASMAARLWGPSHDSAIWLMGNDVYAAIRALEDEDGIVLFETGPDGGRYLHQMPVELCEYTPPLGAAGDIMLCDFSQYLIAEKDRDVLSSIHVKFITDETAMKLRYRVDGAPAWATPIRPKNAQGDPEDAEDAKLRTQSPFIALAARA